jgi:hypothetical protein
VLLRRRIAGRSICASDFRQSNRESTMAIGKPPAPAPAKPAGAAPAQAEPHPRLKRLAREVGAEIPLPPARPAPAETQAAPARPRSYWFTLIRPTQEK